MMKTFLAVIAFAAILATGCQSYRLVNEDKYVKVYVRESLIPGGEDTHRIVIGGKSYDGSYGGLHLEIPEKHLICFQTEGLMGTTYLHVVSTQSEFKEFQIKLEDHCSFGESLGLAKTDDVSTYVDKVDGDDIYFIQHYWVNDSRDYYKLDLKSHTLIQLKSEL